MVPFFIPSYYTGLLTLILIYAIFAMSLDILQGYTGLPSLGHAAFLGTGAYIVAILNVKVFHGPHFSVELLAGVLAAAVVAALIGLIVLRNTGDYLLMILLASSMMLWGIAFKWRSLTGGDDGLPGIVRPDLAFMRVNLHNTTDFYYFVLLFFVIASVLMYLVVRSSFGHTLLGIRESETRMTALGYNVWLQKYIAFIVSGTFAGLAGILSRLLQWVCEPFGTAPCYLRGGIDHGHSGWRGDLVWSGHRSGYYHPDQEFCERLHGTLDDYSGSSLYGDGHACSPGRVQAVQAIREVRLSWRRLQ